VISDGSVDCRALALAGMADTAPTSHPLLAKRRS
jgi:hypothetical protein